jgi:hypothetical protein
MPASRASTTSGSAHSIPTVRLPFLTAPTRQLTSGLNNTVVGQNGGNFTSAQATIWRWRNAYQWDFSGRMRWSATNNYSAVNHNPVVVVNGSSTVADPLYLTVNPGEVIILVRRSLLQFEPRAQSEYTRRTLVRHKTRTATRLPQSHSGSISTCRSSSSRPSQHPHSQWYRRICARSSPCPHLRNSRTDGRPGRAGAERTRTI